MVHGGGPGCGSPDRHGGPGGRLTRVGWNTYEGLLADNPGRIRPLLSYNRGELEIEIPFPEHEQDADTLKFIVVSVSAALAIPVA